MSRVSIVIPCRNAGEQLTEAVNSALAQTWPDVEIIIVDDGSDDPGTIQLLQTANWPRTRIVHQVNAGPASARNHAIRESNGDYILPLDADDTIAADYAAKAMEVLDRDAEIGVVYCKARKFGAEVGPWLLPEFSVRELVLDNVIFATAMYRRSDWEAVGGYDESLLHGMEDYDFWVKLVHRGCGVARLDEYLFNYRIQENSRTSTFKQDRVKIIATYAHIFRTNKDFFADHAEFLFEDRFARNEELGHWRGRYGKLDAFFNSHPTLVRICKRLKHLCRL